MQPSYPASGIELQRAARQDEPALAARKSLNYYSFLLAPGIFGGIVANVIYTPLDNGPLIALGLCLMFLPLLWQLVSMVRRRLADDFSRLRALYIVSGIALAVLALAVFLNGNLDHSQSQRISATVIEKISYQHKSVVRRYLIVSSWRSGRTSEELGVGARTFNRAAAGGSVVIDLHPGLFALPWIENVSAANAPPR